MRADLVMVEAARSPEAPGHRRATRRPCTVLVQGGQALRHGAVVCTQADERFWLLVQNSFLRDKVSRYASKLLFLVTLSTR